MVLEAIQDLLSRRLLHHRTSCEGQHCLADGIVTVINAVPGNTFRSQLVYAIPIGTPSKASPAAVAIICRSAAGTIGMRGASRACGKIAQYQYQITFPGAV